MGSRPTIKTVAQVSGLSTATVDRVLNSRLPVREATALQVLEAAERVGYPVAARMRERLPTRSPTRRIGVYLQRTNSPFYDELARAFISEADQWTRRGMGRCAVRVEFLDAFEPAAIAERMVDLGSQVDALAVVAMDHPHVTEAVAELHRQGKPTLALLSDFSAPLRLGSVLVDDRQRGRTAAWAVRRLARRVGPVGILVGSHRYLGHEAGEMAFRAALREHAPEMTVLDAQVTLEDETLIYEATRSLLVRHPNLVGLYKVGGDTQGMLQALRDQGRRPDLVTVCLELTADNRRALVDGMVDLVLHTPVAAVARTTLEVMMQALAATTLPSLPRAHHVPFEIYTSDNV
jgi:LacI family transcriptional regulator